MVSVCVWPLVSSMQCACAILSSAAFHSLQYFSNSHKQHDFRKHVTGHKMCVLISSTALSEIFRILRRIQRDVIINLHWSSCKAPIIFVRLWWKLNFLHRFSKNTKIWNFKKSVQWEPSSWVVPCGQMNGWTNVTKLTVALRNIAKAPTRYV
jgi:hypothetical protein